jgi:predicted TPR repeat methyltransferase
VALAPEKASSHYNLGLACWENGKAADALSAFRRTLDLDPGLERAPFLVKTLSGEPCETVPREFVKAMYDTHAYRFDVNLVDELQYQIPTDAREAVRDLWGDPDGRSWVIFDVGCGTGLCGPLFRDVATRLVGGDLSPNMIEKARERGTHDELYAEDLTATLARGDVDLVLATDVLIYVDDLRETLEGAGKALRPGGLFSFSTEHEPGDNLTLQTSGRFSHSEGYVRRLAEEFGFAVRHADKTTIRKVGIDDDRDVDGRLYVLELTG